MGVVLLLLIFFMLTSSLIIYPGLKVNLPRTLTSSAVNYENLEIVLTKDEAIYINRNPIKFENLSALLKQVAQVKGSVLIKADKSIALGKISEIWDACRSSGISQINITQTRNE
jgi:biopolymer transport protein ExbD